MCFCFSSQFLAHNGSAENLFSFVCKQRRRYVFGPTLSCHLSLPLFIPSSHPFASLLLTASRRTLLHTIALTCQNLKYQSVLGDIAADARIILQLLVSDLVLV